MVLVTRMPCTMLVAAVMGGARAWIVWGYSTDLTCTISVVFAVRNPMGDPVAAIAEWQSESTIAVMSSAVAMILRVVLHVLGILTFAKSAARVDRRVRIVVVARTEEHLMARSAIAMVNQVLM